MDFDTRLKHPFSMLVCAPSQGGKTVFTCRLVDNIEKMSTVSPERIIWAYCEWQPGYSKIAQIPGVEMVEGIPDIDVLRADKTPKLVVMDDLMEQCSKNPTLNALFTKGCHHWNLSCIHLVQNAFYSNLRNARINSSYLVLFKSPGDKLTVATLARQLYPSKNKYFLQSFNDACSVPYGYLFVDLTQSTDDKLRLRTCVFPDETCIVYMPRI
ncbi:MAG: hypothetical protein GY738_09780 [Pseudoalteromonas sp.]|nr:hypothetical protein [Pseudoalteromonas sp.]